MEKPDMGSSTMDRNIIDFIAYMLTSARGLIDEPAIYGPFRLLDGVSRLCETMIEHHHDDEEFLRNLKGKIDEKKFSVMTDRETFISMMDEVVLDVTHLLMKKSETT